MKNVKSKRKKKNSERSTLSVRGYTLVEVIISVAIFFILVAGPTGLFVFSLRGQTRILGMRGVIDNSSHVLEYLSRTLRMARKELDFPPTCLSSHGLNYEETNSRNLDGIIYSGPGIKFVNYHAECQEFFLDETDGHQTKNQLMESKNGAAPVALTSNDLEITSLVFQLSGQNQTDDLQPRITMLLEMTKKNVLDYKVL